MGVTALGPRKKIMKRLTKLNAMKGGEGGQKDLIDGNVDLRNGADDNGNKKVHFLFFLFFFSFLSFLSFLSFFLKFNFSHFWIQNFSKKTNISERKKAFLVSISLCYKRN